MEGVCFYTLNNAFTLRFPFYPVTTAGHYVSTSKHCDWREVFTAEIHGSLAHSATFHLCCVPLKEGEWKQSRTSQVHWARCGCRDGPCGTGSSHTDGPPGSPVIHAACLTQSRSHGVFWLTLTCINITINEPLRQQKLNVPLTTSTITNAEPFFMQSIMFCPSPWE